MLSTFFCYYYAQMDCFRTQNRGFMNWDANTYIDLSGKSYSAASRRSSNAKWYSLRAIKISALPKSARGNDMPWSTVLLLSKTYVVDIMLFGKISLSCLELSLSLSLSLYIDYRRANNLSTQSQWSHENAEVFGPIDACWQDARTEAELERTIYSSCASGAMPTIDSPNVYFRNLCNL